MSALIAQAIGMDNESPGYEKDGPEIVKLKLNAALALHFLASGDPTTYQSFWNAV